MSDEPTSNQVETNNTELAVGDQVYSHLVEDILSKLEFYFADSMTALFKETDDFLFESANSASSITIQNSMFEFMNALREQKENIEKDFIKGLSFYLQPVSEIEELPKKSHKRSNKLSLVEQDEMDEMVTMTSISGKAAMDLQEELNDLEIRFKHLGELNPSIFHKDALEPRQICDAFQEAVANTDFYNENKLVLYNKFGQHVVYPLKKLYDEINKLMINEGICVEINYSELVHHESAGGYVPTHEEDIADEPLSQQGDAAGPADVNFRPNYAAPQGNNQGARSSGAPGGTSGGTPAAANFTSAPRREFGSGAAYSSRSASDTSQQESNVVGNNEIPANRMSAGFPATQVQQNIQDYVGGVPSNPDAGVASSGGGYYSHNEVVSALSNMQAQTELKYGETLEFDAHAIKKAVLATIGEKQGGVVDKRVNQISEKTVDFIKLVFDAIIEDKGITDTIKTLLLSLQIPIIKAAMLEPDFFVDDEHPARYLLDKIAEAGIGVSDHKDAMFVQIEMVVKKLLKEYTDNIESFQIAVNALEVVTEAVYKKAQVQQELSQKEVRHAHARSIVLQEIRKVTIGKELPTGIRNLVLKIWPSLMFNYFLKNGKATDEWVEMLIILDTIIDSVQPLNSKQAVEELGVSHEEILQATEEKLKRCRKSKDVVDEVINDLRETYKNLMETEDLPDRPAAPVEEEIDEDVIEQEIEASEPEETLEEMSKRKLAMLPDDVQPGTWCIIYNGEDKPVRRLKLAVILMQDATLVFVDYLGNVVIEKDAEVFASELERDLSGVIMQHSVFDHALNSALTSIGT